MSALSRPGVRVAAFAAGLVAIFGLFFGIGAAIGPWDNDPVVPHGGPVSTHHQHDSGGE